jgi:hypothetical protein
MADLIIADCDGDARAAVVQLVAIVRHLAEDNDRLIGTASRMRWPRAEANSSH